MAFDIEMIKEVYNRFGSRIETASKQVDKPLTIKEKTLYTPGKESPQNLFLEKNIT